MRLLLPSIDLSSVSLAEPTLPGHRRYLLQYISPGVFALQIDNSSLEVFCTCPRAAEYKLVHARESGGSAALVYGGAVHIGLETWYKHADEPSFWDEALPLIEDTFSKTPPPLGEWRTFEKCIDTLQRYIKKYPTEPFSIQTYNGQPQIERAFSLPLTVVELNVQTDYSFSSIVDPDTYPLELADQPVYISEVHVYWTGKIDMLIDLDSRPYILDHKTTSVAGPQYFKEYELSQQTIGYCWAASRLYGAPITDFLLNCIIGRKPTPSGVGCEFTRQRYNYRPDQITEWETNITVLVSDFLSNLARGFFPQATKWCFGKYGECPYFQTCTLPPSHRMAMLTSSAYRNVTWSPLN